MVNEETRKQALADYLGIDESEITDGYEVFYGVNEFETPEGDYVVCDEDEGRGMAYESISNLIDDLGVYGLFTPDFISWIEQNALDTEWFEEFFWEDYRSYVEDITYENGRLREELIDAGIIDEDNDMDDDELYDTYGEEYAEYLYNRIDDYIEEFEFQFGKDELNRVLKDNPQIFDYNKVINKAIDEDGVAHELARYDGEEIDLGEYDGEYLYAYRTN